MRHSAHFTPNVACHFLNFKEEYSVPDILDTAYFNFKDACLATFWVGQEYLLNYSRQMSSSYQQMCYKRTRVKAGELSSSWAVES